MDNATELSPRDRADQPPPSGAPERPSTAKPAARPARRWTSRLTAVAIVAALAAVIAYALWHETAAPRTGGRFRNANDGPVPVRAVAATTTDIPVYLEAPGTVRALNTVSVQPQVSGRILNILFREGETVQKGQVLATIDPVTYQAQLDQAVAKKAQDEATLANAKLDLERYTKLPPGNLAITQKQLDTQRSLVTQLTAQVQLDQAAIDNARAILDYTKIAAPISGRTGIRLVDEGNIVGTSGTSVIVTITQVQPISVLFNLPQQELPRINKALAAGQPAVEVLDGDNRTVLDRGTLQVVDNQVDQTTGTVKLKAEMQNGNLQLWPGQFVNVRLLVETLKDSVVVPTAAVQRGPSGPFVYTVAAQNGATTVAVHQVTVTQQDDTRAVIAKGVAATDQVVTTGFARLKDGSEIVIAGPDAPAAAGAGKARGDRQRDAGAKTGDTQPAGEHKRGKGQRRSQSQGTPQ